MSKSESDRKYFEQYNDVWNDCIIRRKEADSFLSSRSRRANTGVEEFGESTVEQECCEEYCDYEEAREIYENERKGETVQEFWKRYSSKTVVTDPPPLVSPPGSLKGEQTNETAVHIIIWPIILAVLVLLILMGFIVYCIWRRKKQQSQEPLQQLSGAGANHHITLTRNCDNSFQFNPKQPLIHSSSSRSHSTNGSSGPPPAYNETVGRVGTLRSQDSGLATGSNSSGSTFQIRDKKLENSIKRCLLDRGRLEVGDLIKEGNFGAVYKGYLNNHGRRELIAVKTLKVLDDNAHFEEFMKEGILTKDFDHINVLKLIGVCMGTNEPPYLLLPYCEHGDLRTYLRNPKHLCVVEDLIRFGRGVCSGMAYLASQNFVHRDLAARNCMIDTKMNIKVSDFGLTRETNQRDYYRSQRVAELPLKWMAPESIKFNYYNEKTDVWAFGITLWEIMTRGQIPYPTIEPVKILTHIETGDRLPKPDHAPAKVYEIMSLCWDSHADERPTFREILPMIDVVLQNSSRNRNNHNRLSEQPQNNRIQHNRIVRSKTDNIKHDNARYVPEWSKTSEKSHSPSRSGRSPRMKKSSPKSASMDTASMDRRKQNRSNPYPNYTTLQPSTHGTMRSHQ